MLRYKGYECDYQYDEEDLIWYGKLEDIRDLVSFESETYDGLEEEFHKAVDDYLEFCKEAGKEPDNIKCCGTCAWYAEFEGVCCCADSEWVAYFRDSDYVCECWRENRNDRIPSNLQMPHVRGRICKRCNRKCGYCDKKRGAYDC